MASLGQSVLSFAFILALASLLGLLAGYALARKQDTVDRPEGAARITALAGHAAVFISAIALTICCVLLVYCFFSGDNSLEYVVQNRSKVGGASAWLYKLSGLWAGRGGSLLFWAWLISLFNTIVAIKNLKSLSKLDTMALFVSQLVLIAFISVVLFSQSNFPFKPMGLEHFDAGGNLIGVARYWGMNPLLEHWAMAVHPPTLFIGYAGLTIPFAYAISALIVNDPSKAWVQRCDRYTLFSWLFLGIGIGLGAVWAYVVLGWGGYWGWDAVENASLLPWLVGLALIHSFTVYRIRGMFRSWTIMCACLAFAFVVVGTFITRSGIVESVHAFDGDSVSLALFLALIIASLLAGFAGLFIRRRSFGSPEPAEPAGHAKLAEPTEPAGPAQSTEPAEIEAEGVDSFTSRDTAYYLNNVVMVIVAFVLLYLTVLPALPSWLPLGGQTISPVTYNTIARPLGILYCLLIAVCPLLSWGRTDGRSFFKQALVPGICSLVVLALLVAYFLIDLEPSYQATILGGGTNADTLREYGPAWYYNGLALVGFLVASLLFFNALFLMGRTIRTYAKSHELSFVAACDRLLRIKTSTFGAFIAHLAMAVVLVGLICSSMYVTERISQLGYGTDSSTAKRDFAIKDYLLVHTGAGRVDLEGRSEFLYEQRFDVYKNGVYIGSVRPAMQMTQKAQEFKLVAATLSLPTEDLFVVFRGTSQEGLIVLDVRINPLISFVWAGFILMMIGILMSTLGRRRPGGRGYCHTLLSKVGQ